ncbi:single-stranded DNA-binding protein [Selenomonas sp. oral taxon 136]|uniref:single-stranded DNA-binding protein n=1 Tax=Selenomonas sp. oral taxon 136 TaxID=713030 RepID=UPI000768330C|nr:single-stranded DNA-binding protein [Selenomonas sp. oral taxon 136]AME02684.1 single-stranded DNA-binding protein [Selenomonas sp. oral taxon 136]
MNVSFFGRLTKAPEVKTNQMGTTYTAFTVATQVQAKGQDGKAKTLFIDVSAFGKQGENIVKYFTKGSRIVIHGDIFDARAWVGNNDNQPHFSMNVTMNGFDFVDTQAESAARQQGAAPAQVPQVPPAQAVPAGYAPQIPPPMQTGAVPWAPPAYGGQPQQGLAYGAPAQPAPAQNYAAAPY